MTDSQTADRTDDTATADEPDGADATTGTDPGATAANGPDAGADSDAAADAAAASPHVGAGLLDEEMGPSSAMAHLYRGEIHRMKFWRERLDRTTNWAVIVIAALLTWAFSGADNPHYLLLVGVATLTVFLVIESRRYRGYDIWRTRVRTIQENVWAYGLDPDAGVADEDWRRNLGRDYRRPTLKITAEEAIAHRLRRVYLPLFAVLLAAWVIRITAFSTAPWTETAAVGTVPGVVVAAVVGAFFVGAVVVACRPRTWHAEGELRREDLRKER
ncbi:DUF2270 domain-containing protein [Halobaculum lipolyticum]|uniref:DUF2270 domain-containing protein n=1 Tax=Halobaculum lipolyticum TaxID=3032001 RepID=A0ABD5W6C9_9EURY|nr:DUF2270 domain-containing protein [Halobaculum sp. DT31]